MEIAKCRVLLRKIAACGLTVILLLCSGCSLSKKTTIVPDEGYSWPSTVRDYWPTDGWRMARPGGHGIDVAKLAAADAFVKNDPLTRCLLVVNSIGISFSAEPVGDAFSHRLSHLATVRKHKSGLGTCQ